MDKILLGIFFIIVGFIFLIYSQELVFGNINNMGPGFFPKIISLITILLGLIIVIKTIKWKF